ncbi:MAG TPA: acetate--CoA ligase family protein [Bellilinea sp.]|nr:acetate--CoA ligase family protein [Bellilinea sp.]
MKSDLTAFYQPRGVAIFGASTSPAKLSHGILRNLSQYGYRGQIVPINPKADEILGYRCYPDLTAAPDPLDLAVLVLPAGAILPAVQACGERGIRAAIIISGGFKEVGAEGAALEQAVLTEAARWGMRLVGPNCVGTLDMFSGLDVTFIEGRPEQGGIGFISQSGAVGGGLIDQIRGKGIGFANFASLGNEADLTETDFIDYLSRDPHTRVIAAYVEMIRDGQRFLQTATKTTPKKPLVILKAGRTEAGARAVSSHTGSLAGSHSAYRAAFRQSGAIEVESVAALIETAQGFDLQPLPAGDRVALITNAGGPAALVSDQMAAAGLSLANLTVETQAVIRQGLNPAAQTANPVDMLGGAGAGEYELALRAALLDEGVDAAIVILVPQVLVKPEDVARAVAAAAQGSAKPVLALLMGEYSIGLARQYLHGKGIPVYTQPESPARVLGAMRRYARWKALPPSAPRAEELDMLTARRIIALAGQRQTLGEVQTRPLLAACGIEQAAGDFATNSDAALRIAEDVGYPVALKVVSAQIFHKSDVGGVALNLETPQALRAAWNTMMERVRSAQPEAEIDGALVEKMSQPGKEVIVGMRRDASFGPLLMFGSGGTAVELFGDVAFRVSPLSVRDAEEMIAETQAGRLLSGFRGEAPVPLDGIINTLLRLSRLAMACPQIEEMEINPLRVFTDGRVLALDGRVLLSSAQTG